MREESKGHKTLISSLGGKDPDKMKKEKLNLRKSKKKDELTRLLKKVMTHLHNLEL